MHRAADDADIIDGIRQPRLRRNLLSHSRINPPVACLRPGGRGIALRVLSPPRFQQLVVAEIADASAGRKTGISRAVQRVGRLVDLAC
jgi:hypothetical protein